MKVRYENDYNNIELPVINRRIALLRLLYIGGVLIALSILTTDKFAIWITISMNIIVFAVIIWRKNIRKVYFQNENITVNLNNQVISIPINNIESISSAISHAINFKGRSYTIFTFELKNKYIFGSNLLLEFEHDEIPIIEPLIISQIKAIMEYEASLRTNY